jgi:hypothetical protein
LKKLFVFLILRTRQRELSKNRSTRDRKVARGKRGERREGEGEGEKKKASKVWKLSCCWVETDFDTKKTRGKKCTECNHEKSKMSVTAFIVSL